MFQFTIWYVISAYLLLSVGECVILVPALPAEGLSSPAVCMVSFIGPHCAHPHEARLVHPVTPSTHGAPRQALVRVPHATPSARSASCLPCAEDPRRVADGQRAWRGWPHRPRGP